MPRSKHATLALSAVLALLTAVPARSGEAVASKSLTVQKAGVRPGKPGEAFLNVEGKTNGEDGKYASFGVLEFPAKDLVGDAAPAGLELVLTQSVARFSVDGPVKFYLATADLDAKGLKFDPSGVDGLGGQFASRRPLGAGSFKKAETGKADTFALTLDDEAKAFLKDRAGKGGSVAILVVPDNDTVAATYFGAGADEADRRPRLKTKP